MKPGTARSARPRLDLPRIVDAAIDRVERHGLEQLSARKLAQDLGCEAMSLYHHVGNMELLKDAMVDRLLGSITPGKAPEPAEALREEAAAFLDLARTRPRSFQLIATRRWKGDRAAAAAGRVVGYFQALGAAAPEALARARTLGAYLNGAGLALAAWATDPDARKEDAEQVRTDLRQGLDVLLGSLASPG